MDGTSYSLGMIETWGFPALVAAADAAAKAADVKIVTFQGADAGIVTIYIIGDVASVQAAVAIGEQEAKRVGTLLASHVIARPDHSVREMIRQMLPKPAAAAKPEPAAAGDRTDVQAAAADTLNPAGQRTDEALAATAGEGGQTPALQSRDQADSQSGGEPDGDSAVSTESPTQQADQPSDWARKPVAELRRIARSMADFPLSGQEISVARKEELIRYLNERTKDGGGADE